MNRLFIVSNRLPVNIQETEGDLQVHRSAGGLVAAISSYIQGQHIKGPRQFSEVYWAGVPGCTAATWTKAERKLAEQEYQYLPVFIRKRCYDAYYNGYANSLIWPLFHYFPSYADFDGDYFDDYMEANRCFLDALMLQVRPGDTIWIHDYHLMPLAGLIRQELPGVSIGFFLHIPFPSYEIFRMMPVKWQEAVIRGMMGADLIGFHTIDYATHFLKTVQMVLGLEDDMHVVRYMDRLVKVDVFPISIDYDQFHQAYQDKEVAAYRKSFSERFGNKKIIFSADRLDYTKGVFSRLKAYEHFLLQNPEYHGQVLFVLIVVPSRDHISRYAERKKMIDEYVGDINSRIGKINWQPVIYQYANLEFPELVAMYSSCHLALITPLRDGMNLVAKEFVACRQDRKGVLVLSELAGAAKELPDALLINPNDHADIALKIKQGLEMPAGEQSRRMQAMQQRVKLYNIRTWAEDFIGQLQSVKARQTAYEVKFLDTYGRIELRQRYQDAGKRLLLLDYDGTLVPFSALPTEAAPGRELLDVLTALTADNRNEVYIISGRDSNTLHTWLGHLPVHMVAEHGAKRKMSGSDWQHEGADAQAWKKQVREIMEGYVSRCANSFIETKDYSIAWHYRNANPEQARVRSSELFAELREHIRSQDLNIVHGNKVIEVRNHGVDKGAAVKRILAENDYEFILALGDDTTDEDMFRVLGDYDHAYTLKVGNQASYARFNIHSSYMVLSLLEGLAAGMALQKD